MDVLFEEEKLKLDALIPKVNPLSCTTNVKHLLAKTDDILDLDEACKLSIKKDYKNFCRVHHPDKTTDEENSAGLYIMKQYGEAFLRPIEDDFKVVWVFMGYAAMTFAELKLEDLNVTEICKINRDIGVLEDLVAKCEHLWDETRQVIREVKRIFTFMKQYTCMKEDGYCMIHSDEISFIQKSDCENCRPIKEEIIVIDLIESDDVNHIEPESEKLSYSQSYEITLRSELNSLDTKTLLAIAKSKDLDLMTINEKNDLIDIIVESDLKEPDIFNVKNHKKRVNPKRKSIPHDTWEKCIIENVDSLPYDIDGTKIYELPYDPSPNMKMRSSIDGRKWGTWATSSRRGFNGISMFILFNVRSF